MLMVQQRKSGAALNRHLSGLWAFVRRLSWCLQGLFGNGTSEPGLSVAWQVPLPQNPANPHCPLSRYVFDTVSTFQTAAGAVTLLLLKLN